MQGYAKDSSGCRFWFHNSHKLTQGYMLLLSIQRIWTRDTILINIAIKWQQRHLLLEMKIIQNGAHKIGYLIQMHFLLHWNLCVSRVLYKNWTFRITQLHKWIYLLVLLYEIWNCIIGQEIDFWTPIHCKRMIGKNIFDYINNILFQIEKVGTIGNVVLIFY